MPIVTTDIKIRLSGGASNTDPNASLGGAKSSTEVVDNSLSNIFDLVSGTESNAGDTEFRAVYVHNSHATLTMLTPTIYISSNTTSTDDTWEIALGSSAINATEQTIANEGVAPTGVTFVSTAIDYATGLASADIPAGQHRSIWFKRIVSPGAAAIDSNAASIKVDCDTAA